MKITVNDTLGIQYVEIELAEGQITEVVGPNASGKTSLVVCAQAVLARDDNPLSVSAAEAKRVYPHNEAEDARVELTASIADDVVWMPYRGVMNAGAGGPLCHPDAVGITDFTAKRSGKDRAALFQDTLMPPMETVMEAVQARMAALGVDAKDLAGVMEMIADRGWDATEGVYAERGRDAKRQWCEITGRRQWGVKIGSDWRPDGWLADFDHMTVQECEARVTDARDALNAMHRVQAVSEAEQQAAERAAADLTALETRLGDLRLKHARATAERDAIPILTLADEKAYKQRELDDLRRERGTHRECPHCQGSLSLDKGNIVAGRQPQEMELAMSALQDEIQAIESRCDEMNERRNPIIRQLRHLDEEIRDALSLVNNCKAFAAKTGVVQTEADRIALAQAEQAVEDAREVVRLVSAEAKATELHGSILRYTEIAGALGPEGVRSQMKAKGLATLNAGLAVIATASGWPLTEVSDTNAITVGGRPVQMCSESERWRAQTAIQLTLGAITKSKAVVLDRGDLLDEGNRAGLVKAANRVAGKTGMAVLLCSTGTPAADAPWPVVEIKNGRTE